MLLILINLDKRNLFQKVLKGQMSAKPDETLDGNIKITSPIPTNNTPRYFTLIVTNADGLKQEVKIEQYPLEYITSTPGILFLSG